MKTLSALILAVFAASSFAAEPCALPLPKIIGSDYHTARAKLIKHGCLPVPYSVADEGGRPAPEDAAMLGYIEADHSGQGSGGREFAFRKFTVYANGCSNLVDRRFQCTVRSVDHH